MEREGRAADGEGKKFLEVILEDPKINNIIQINIS
jgi:hypothetical protein